MHSPSSNTPWIFPSPLPPPRASGRSRGGEIPPRGVAFLPLNFPASPGFPLEKYVVKLCAGILASGAHRGLNICCGSSDENIAIRRSSLYAPGGKYYTLKKEENNNITFMYFCEMRAICNGCKLYAQHESSCFLIRGSAVFVFVKWKVRFIVMNMDT